LIPLKPLREILKQDCPYDVSNEAVILLRDQLEGIARAIKQESIKEFERYNDHRCTQGLPFKKRLNRWAIMKGHSNALKQESNTEMGSQYEEVGSLGDEIMSVDKSPSPQGKSTVMTEVHHEL